MAWYRIGDPDLNGKVYIEDLDAGKVFNGYDFMGSVIWEDYGGDAYWMEPDEAEQIIRDLEAADTDEDENAEQTDGTIISAQCKALADITEQIRFYAREASVDQANRMAEILRQAAVLLVDMATPNA